MWSPSKCRRSSLFLTFVSRPLGDSGGRVPRCNLEVLFCVFLCLCDLFTSSSIARLALAFDIIYLTHCILYFFVKVLAQWWANLGRLGHNCYSNVTQEQEQEHVLGEFW